MLSSVDLYSLYQKLPSPLRSLADVGYRFIPERMLRSRSVHAMKDEIDKSQWLPTEEIKMLQFLRLKDLLIHAGETTAYYKRVFNEAGFDPRAMQDFSDIMSLPILKKEDIIDYKNDLRSSLYPDDTVYGIQTSGSTGKYLEFVQAKEYYDRELAFTERYVSWMGATNKWKKAVFYRAIMKHPVTSDSHPPYERFRNRLIMSQFHTDDESFSYYVQLLNDFQPEYFLIFPSTAVSLTRYCKKHGTARFAPKAIMCYSENLLPEHREEVADFWKCKVYNRYGHGEGCVSAGDCDHGNMHLSAEYGYTEFLHKDGSPAKPGELARMISTGLFTHAMPFIRYDTGDMGILSNKPCACGRGLPVLERVDGRGDAIVYSRDGKEISALRSIFVHTHGIKASQIVQERAGELIIRLVPDSDFESEVQNTVLKNLHKDAGDSFDVRFEIVDDIERSPSGKVRLVISKIRQDV